MVFSFSLTRAVSGTIAVVSVLVHNWSKKNIMRIKVIYTYKLFQILDSFKFKWISAIISILHSNYNKSISNFLIYLLTHISERQTMLFAQYWNHLKHRNIEGRNKVKTGKNVNALLFIDYSFGENN